MLSYRNIVSHRVTRAVTVRGVQEHRVRPESVCDADALLLAAAAFHGDAADAPCPICGSDHLRTVRWIYGDTLGDRSGTARREDEIAWIVAEVTATPVPRGKDGVVSVHLVEVCSQCRWNHLLTSAEAYLVADNGK